MLMKLLPLILFFTGFFTYTTAQQKADEWMPVFKKSSDHDKTTSGYFLVRTKKPGTAGMLAGKGFQVLRQLSDYTFIVTSPGKDTAFFSYSFPANAHWKRSEERRVGKECRSRWWP